MKTIRWSTLLVITLLGTCNLSGCSVQGLLNSQRPLDLTTDAQGQHLIADTPHNWNKWNQAAERLIANETKGTGKGEHPTWNEFWVSAIRSLEKLQENAPRHVDAIIEMRRRAGLPELAMTTDAQGLHIVADTQQNWLDWRSDIDPQIAGEAMGVELGYATWSQRWLWRIRNLEELQENAPRYIDYLIETRRSAGLPEFDMTRNAQGLRILADTPQNWLQWRSFVDPKIEKERMGIRPSPRGGYPNWNDEWRKQIEALEKIQENAPRYIDYLIEMRRSAGLPEIRQPK